MGERVEQQLRAEADHCGRSSMSPKGRSPSRPPEGRRSSWGRETALICRPGHYMARSSANRAWSAGRVRRKGARTRPGSAKFQLEQPRRVLPDDFHLRFGLERHGVELLQHAGRLDKRVVATE